MSDKFVDRPSKFSIWYDYVKPAHPDIHELLKTLIAREHHNSIHSHRPLIDDLKIKKSQAERNLVRESCRIAAEGLKETILFSKPGMKESLLEAKMSFVCHSLGADRLSFPPVIASGPRANIIHYIRNDQIMQDGEMVLMDTGCEFHGYSSDLTRTWPISGRFSDAQRILYEIVHETQQICMRELVPGQSLDCVHRIMLMTLATKLRDSGVLTKIVSVSTDEQLIKIGQMLCPHHVSHYLGTS